MTRVVEIEKPRGWVDAEEIIRAASALEAQWELERMRFYVPKPDPDMLKQMRIEAASERSPISRKLK